ncbi:hypothetical protein QCD71_24145, partial [Sphingomonas sp. PsM26]|nr:hypothetical protein [Sphingomonas sp. PsM26]
QYTDPVNIISITGRKKASSVNNNELALFYLDISPHTRVIMYSNFIIFYHTMKKRHFNSGGTTIMNN